MLILYIHRALVNGVQKTTYLRLFCHPCQRTFYYDTTHLDGTEDLLIGCKQCKKTKLRVLAIIFK